MTPDACLKRTPKAAWQDIDGETVLLIGEEEKLLGLNPVAGRIWRLADGSRTAAEIADLIAREFDGPRERIPEDTLAFARMLVARGLLEAGAHP